MDDCGLGEHCENHECPLGSHIVWRAFDELGVPNAGLAIEQRARFSANPGSGGSAKSASNLCDSNIRPITKVMFPPRSGRGVHAFQFAA
ncbi:MAG: hypothetical protein RL367_49 [Pseudomonadota bacterium]